MKTTQEYYQKYHGISTAFLWLIFLFTSSNLAAQIQFDAKVSKSKLALNERLRVDFVMNADGDNFRQPTFEGFQVITGPIQQVSQSWVNGKSSFNKTYSYILLPTREGKISIKQASIEIEGEIYKTTPVEVTVTAAVQQPRDPNDNSVTKEDAIHLEAEVSKSNPYINEPITVIYKLYVSYDVNVNQWRPLDNPKYNNFWSQNIDIKNLVVEDCTYKGERFRCVVLRKTVLYPQKEGKLEIEGLTLDIDLQLPTRRRDFFGRPLMTNDSKRVATGSKFIQVKPLPENGKPEDFSGAVGSFDFQVTPSRNYLKHGESVELKMTVSGSGNLKLIDLPKPIVPSAFEMYDPVKKEEVNTSLKGMSGKIISNYTLIPQFKGNFVIKPISFSYFDLKSGSYKTLSSPPIEIEVLDGPSASNSASAEGNSGVQKQKVETNSQFKFIHLKTNLSDINRKPFLGSTSFYLALFIPLIFIPIVVFLKKKKEAIDGDLEGQKRKLNSKLAKKFLSEAKNQLANKDAFYVAMEKSLHNFLKFKLKIETSEFHKEKIQALLLERKAQPETVDLFIKLLENCEMARYGLSSSVAISDDYEKAVQVITSLEKQLR
jgi:hypothetical protein